MRIVWNFNTLMPMAGRRIEKSVSCTGSFTIKTSIGTQETHTFSLHASVDGTQGGADRLRGHTLVFINVLTPSLSTSVRPRGLTRTPFWKIEGKR